MSSVAQSEMVVWKLKSNWKYKHASVCDLWSSFTVKELQILPNNLNDHKVKSRWLEIIQEVV